MKGPKSCLLLLFSLIFLGLLSGCGNNAGKTQAKLSISIGKIAAPELSTYSGGAILMGMNDLGDSFSVNLMDMSEGFTMVLDNGLWRFYGFLWDGLGGGTVNRSMEGVIRCALTNVNLSGDEISVPINFTNAECDRDIFAVFSLRDVNGTTHAFKNRILHSCLGPVPAGGTGCINNIAAPTVPSNQKMGFFRSFRYRMETYDSSGRMPSVGSPLVSDCYSVDIASGNGSTFISPDSTKINIPWGNGSLAQRISVIAYEDEICMGSRGTLTRTFNNGLYIPNDQRINGIKSNFDGSNNNLFFEVSGNQFCNSTYPPPLGSFRGGNGSNLPYAICTAEEFETIGRSTFLNDNFALLKNLNFRERIPIPGVSLFPHPCGGLEPPSNFIPVGRDCTNLILAPDVFTGKFFGHGNKISNAFFNASSATEGAIGIFGNLGGGGIYNLDLDNPRMEGRDLSTHTGTLVGEVSSTSATIKGVKIKKGLVEASDFEPSAIKNTGGLAGYCQGPISDVVIQDFEVLGKGAVTGMGGICGGHLGGTIDRVYFDGSIRHDKREYNNPGQKIGGILGQVNGAITLNQVASKGSIISYGKYVGGIVGGNNSNATIIDQSYSQMMVNSFFDPFDPSIPTDGPIFLGGFIGNSSSSTIQNSYFSGHISYTCNNGVQANCNVGNLSGNSPSSSVTKSFTSASAIQKGGVDLPPTLNTELDFRSNLTSSPISDLNSTFSFENIAASAPSGGSYPRLIWESDGLGLDIINNCQLFLNTYSVSSQVANGKGSPLNPISLCHSGQFVEIKNHSDKYYKMLDHINLDSIHNGSDSHVINTFSGGIDGRGRVLMGGNIISSSSTPVGLIRTNTGTIKDLNLLGLKVDSSVGDGGTGSIAGVNSGEIKEVVVAVGKVIGDENVGGVVGKNDNLISGVTSGGAFRGEISAGGIAGYNEGTIEKATNFSSFDLSAVTSLSNIGGIVGRSNGGVIRESSFSSSFIMPSMITATNLGGIVGLAEGSTQIYDTVSEDNASLWIDNGTNIGGLVGELFGSSRILRSYNAAEVKYESGWGQAGTYGGVVGLLSSSAIMPIGNNVFFTTRPYSNDGTYDISYSTPWTTPVLSTDCKITITSSSPTLPSGTTAFINDHNKVFSVDTATAGFITIENVVGPGLFSNCNELEMYILDYGSTTLKFNDLSIGGNSNGHQKTDIELKDFNTFSAFNIADFSNPLHSNWINLVNYHFAIMFGEPIPSSSPKWGKNGDEYPRLLNHR